MSTFALTRVKTWEQIEAAANAQDVLTCIRPGQSNWNRAKNTWEEFGTGDSPDVLYFIVHKKHHAFFGMAPSKSIVGYIRFLKTTQNPHLLPTWVVDFVRPNLYEPIILASQQLKGTVLTPIFGTADAICTSGWPIITAAFPKIAQYPHCIRFDLEYTYLVIPKYPSLPDSQ